jgi:hypothetical protein
MPEQTRSQLEAANIAAKLRARCPLIWIQTREEQRVEGFIYEANASALYETRFWDIAAGTTDIAGKPDNVVTGEIPDPDPVLEAVFNKGEGTKGTASNPKRIVWVLRDYPAYLNGPNASATLRRMRNLVRWLPSQPTYCAQAIIIISPSAEIPAELQNTAALTEWPLPDRVEIGTLLDACVNKLPEDMRKSALPNGDRDAAIDAAVGLSGEEAQATFAASLVKLRRIDPVTVAQEKKRVIAKAGGLEWFDPLPDGLDAVGGLENLKGWLVKRALAYSPEARAYGLPSPKGALLGGIPGCGKSLCVRATGTAYGVPVLKVDLGALKGKFVGESEANIRNTFKVAEAIGRCILWVDEIEKALQGATGGAADGGVSADTLGFLLNWMQERQGEAFVMATANNVDSLPPELMRKGRFDEVWWVDVPNDVEREGVLAASLRSHSRGHVDIDLRAVSEATAQFTGSEIAALVPDAMFTAFEDGAREITTQDLLDAAKGVNPLAVLKEKEFAELRSRWSTRMRPASLQVAAVAATGASVPQLDLG